MTPGNKYAYTIFKDYGLIYRIEGVKYFICYPYFIYSFQVSYDLQYIKAICIKINYGCGQLGVVNFATESLRMSEFALDSHLPR